MITKILKIKNLGRLNIPVSDNPTEENTTDSFSFRKNTLIFGDNTCGKTTLVSVFKSLSSGESLDNRKKFRSQDPIQIKIKYLDGEVYKFHEYGKNTWKDENILIFDSDFIRDNIFSEDQIKGEHLKSLPRVLIGDGIKQDIEQINSIVKCDNGLCENCEFCLNYKFNQHKNSFRKDFQLDQFLKIRDQILEGDKQIIISENKLSVNEKLSDLQKKISESNFYKFDVQAIEDLFDKKIDNKFETVIEKHLLEKTNNLERAKGFLGYGLKLKKGDVCPFCSQDTTNVQEFMDSLSNYFDEEYKKFKEEIETLAEIFISFDLEKELLTFRNFNLTSIDELLEGKPFEQALINVKNKIKQKKENLNFDCNFQNDQDFILLKEVFSKSKEILTEVENRQALTFQEKTLLNQDLIAMRLNKYRYSREGSTFYDEYENVRKSLEEKDSEKRIAQEKLKKKVEAIFGSNLKDINLFLEELRADFRIKRLTPSVDNRDRYNFLKINEYQFEFIDMQGDSISVEIEKFKETFSDSDKRLLGFAFFLSILRNDMNLDKKIIILDDPFSSFDINRREETIKLFDNIKNVAGKEPSQKIIFTHEKSFYCELNRLISTSDKNLLKLNYSTLNNGTMLEAVDVKKFESDKYYGDLDYINNAIRSNTNLDEALPKARECAEYLLKAKYINTLESYRDKDGNRINFNVDSINSFLNAIDKKCPVKKELLGLELHRFHHSQEAWKTELPDKVKNQILADFIKLIELI